MVFEIGDEGFVHHVVDDLARGVERAGLFAGGGAGFGVVGGEEVLEDLAQQFGVEGDFLFDRGVLRDGELVAVEGVDQAAHFGAFESGLAIGLAQVHLAFLAEEKKVGDGERVVGAVGEAVNADMLWLFLSAPTVLSRHSKEPPLRKGMSCEQLATAVWNLGTRLRSDRRYESCGAGRARAFASFAAKLAVVGFVGRVHLSVERGEEEVLQDGLVVECCSGAWRVCRLLEQSLAV